MLLYAPYVLTWRCATNTTSPIFAVVDLCPAHAQACILRFWLFLGITRSSQSNSASGGSLGDGEIGAVSATSESQSIPQEGMPGTSLAWGGSHSTRQVSLAKSLSAKVKFYTFQYVATFLVQLKQSIKEVNIHGSQKHTSDMSYRYEGFGSELNTSQESSADSSKCIS